MSNFLFKSFSVYPSPVNLSFGWCFGFLAAFVLGVQLVSGVVLSLFYTPTAELAPDSIRFIMRELDYGWLLRYIHMNGASMFFIAVYCHVFRSAYYGSFTIPRTNVWLSGITLFILLIATAFFGYVLPWGQMSYWGTTVISGLATTIPLFGNFILLLLWSGDAINTLTLHRFYTLHFLTPFIIASVSLIHLWFLHEGGSNNPLGFFVKDNLPLHQYFSFKDLIVVFFFFLFFVFLVFFEPYLLGNPVNILPADTIFTPKKMVPEWYFLPFYTILRSVSSKGGGLFLVVVLFLFLYLLPALGQNQLRNSDYVFGLSISICLLFLCFIGLCWAGSQSLDAPWIFLSRFFTVTFFFILFFVLPSFNVSYNAELSNYNTQLSLIKVII
jgi:ubiquinol-cytochrome c reductase cytochrome b subunit